MIQLFHIESFSLKGQPVCFSATIGYRIELEGEGSGGRAGSGNVGKSDNFSLLVLWFCAEDDWNS
jgi:hypothetical protein